MWEELGISSGTAFIILGALYFIIKWAVRNAIIEAHEKIKDNEEQKVQKPIDKIIGQGERE